jgi:hypothetical protein
MPQMMATFGALLDMLQKMTTFGALLKMPQKFICIYYIKPIGY